MAQKQDTSAMRLWRREALAREWNGRRADEALTSMASSEKYDWPQYVSALAPIVMVYLALAVYRMDDQSLWTDEVISVIRTSGSIWTRLYSQSPLYFLLLGEWSKLAGTTEFALRFLSTVLGVAAVWITYAIGFRLFNRKIAVIAAMLLATSPYLIWYSQEVRYVTLLIVTSLAMTYSFQRAISGGLATWWVSYGVTSLMGLFTFVTVIFIVMAHGVYVLCSQSHRPLLRRWMASQLLTLLVFAIWFGLRSAPKLIAVVTKAPAVTSHEQARSREILPLADLAGMIPYTFYAFSVGFSFGPSVRELQTSRSVEALLSHAPTLVPAAVLFASLFLLGLARQQRDTGIFLLLWISTPIIGAFVVATMTTYHVYNTRYVAMALPAYILILASAIGSFHRLAVQFVLLTCVLSVNGISLANYYFDTRYEREDARSAAQYLESATRPGDVILVVGNLTPFRYYYKGTPPIIPFHTLGEEDMSVVAKDLRALGNDHDRLWLIEIRAWEGDPKRKVKTTLDNLFSVRQHKAFPGVDVYTYDVAVGGKRREREVKD